MLPRGQGTGLPELTAAARLPQRPVDAGRAPITCTVRGITSEVPVGPRNGLDHDSVVSCDNITTVCRSAVGDTLGLLFDDQEPALARAITDAFDLDLG